MGFFWFCVGALHVFWSLYHSQAFSIQVFAVLSRVDEVLGFFAGFVLGNRSLPVKTRENPYFRRENPYFTREAARENP